MTLRLSDLPPGSLRDQALRKMGKAKPAPVARRPKVRGLALICGRCGERLEEPSESAIDRHGCTGRYECDLEAG